MKPSLWFTCGMIHYYSRYGHEIILVACREVTNALAAHRKKAMCHCDLSYIVTGESRRRTTRLCTNTEIVHTSVRNAIHLHDRICCCGCFKATTWLGKKHLVDVQGRPDLRTRVVLRGLTDGDELCIICICVVAFVVASIWIIRPKPEFLRGMQCSQ